MEELLTAVKKADLHIRLHRQVQKDKPKINWVLSMEFWTQNLVTADSEQYLRHENENLSKFTSMFTSSYFECFPPTASRVSMDQQLWQYTGDTPMNLVSVSLSLNRSNLYKNTVTSSNLENCVTETQKQVNTLHDSLRNVLCISAFTLNRSQHHEKQLSGAQTCRLPQISHKVQTDEVFPSQHQTSWSSRKTGETEEGTDAQDGASPLLLVSP